MKIAVIGTGYVGLVTATCFAESGNDVVGIDKDAAKIKTLDDGRLPIYEPGLLELVQRNCREQRLSFTTDLAKGIENAKLIFIAVGTPQADSGAANLNALWSVGDALAANIKNDALIVIKSTVPVGTNRQLTERIKAKGRTIEVACVKRLAHLSTEPLSEPRLDIRLVIDNQHPYGHATGPSKNSRHAWPFGVVAMFPPGRPKP